MSDNKKYIGKIDRIRVSETEHYEVDYFVDHYLKTKGYGVSAENRKVLHGYLEDYPHHGTVMRDHLTQWLDANIKK